MKKNGRIKELTDKLGRELDINTFESFFLSLNSVNELYIKGCGTILFCSESEMYLKGANKKIRVIGEKLTIQTYTENEIIIKGKIKTISFEEETAA